MWKTFVLILVVSLAVLLIFVATRPGTFKVSRSLVVQAPPEKIYPLINDMKAFNRWNPYEKKDPNVKGTYSGPAAGPGAAYDFDGNKEVGKGRIAITGATPNSRVAMNLKMISPFEVDNNVWFGITPEGGGTRVSWNMDGPVPYLAKIAHLVFDMDKMIGADFEAGLAGLKVIAEKS